MEKAYFLISLVFNALWQFGVRSRSVNLKSSFILIIIIAYPDFSSAFTASSRATGNWATASTWMTTRTGTITCNTGSTTVSGVGTLFSSELANGQVLMTISGTVIGTISSRTNNTTLVLTGNAAVAVTAGAYTGQIVPATGDSVVVGHTVTQNAGPLLVQALNITSTGIVQQTSNNNEMDIGTGAGPTGGGLTVDGQFIVTTSNARSTLSGFYIKGSGIIDINGGDNFRLNINTLIPAGADIKFIGSSGSDNLDLNTATLTNLGTMTVGPVMNIRNAGSLINSTNATFNYNFAGTMPDILTCTASGNTVNFGGTGATMPNNATYVNLISSSTGTTTMSTTLTSATNLTISSGTLDAATNSRDITIVGGAWTNNGGTFNYGTRTVTFSGTTSIGGTSVSSFYNIAITSGTLTGPVGNMNVAGNWATSGTGIFSPPVGNTVTFNGTTALTSAVGVAQTFRNVVVNGTLTEAANKNIQISGNWTTAGTFTQTATGAVVFNGSSAQTITGITIFNNLTLSNSSGLSINDNITVGSTLQLNNNILIATTDTLVITATTGSVSRTGGTSSGGFVAGNLRRAVTTAAAVVTYDVGTTTYYEPITLTFVGANTTGYVTVGTHPTSSPDAAASLIDPNKDVNRYWGILTPPFTPTTFTSYTATLNYDASAETGDQTNYNLSILSPTTGLWTVQSTPSIRTTTQTIVAGITGFGDLYIGENYNPSAIYNGATGTFDFDDATKWIQYRSGTIYYGTGVAASTITVYGAGQANFSTQLQVNDWIVLQSAPSVTFGQVASIVNSQEMTVVLTSTIGAPVVSPGNSFARRVAPSNSLTPDNSPAQVFIGGTPNLTAAQCSVRVDATVSVFSITIAQENFGHVLTQSGANLTLTQSMTINQANNANTNSWVIGANTGTVTGNLVIGSQINSTTQVATVSLSSGTLNIETNLVFKSGDEPGATLTTSGNSNIYLAGDLILTNTGTSFGTLVHTSGTFYYDGISAAQTVNLTTTGTDIVYRNLTISNTSTGASLATAISTTNVTGNLTVSTNGTLYNAGYAIANDGDGADSFELQAGATFIMTGTSAYPTGFTAYTLASTSNVKYRQTTNPFLMATGATSYGNLYLEPQTEGGSIKFFNATYTISGNLIMGDGLVTTTVQSDNNSATVNVTGDVTINANTTFDPDGDRDLNLSLRGNWINYGTFIPGARTITFNGSANAQTITNSSGSETFYSLSINSTFGTAPQLSIAHGVRVTNDLRLYAGILSIGNYDLTLSSGCTTYRTGTTAITLPYDGIVSWVMTGGAGSLVMEGTGTSIFPVGYNTTKYNPIEVANTGTTDNFSVRVGNNVLANGTSGTAYTNGCVDRTWYVEEAVIGGSSVTLTVQWVAGDELTGFNRGSCNVAHHDGTTWQGTTNGANSTSGSVYYRSSPSGRTSFSPYALQSNNVLPIELLNFEAILRHSKVDLAWVTGSEINNDYFTVERSLDTENFEFVTEVAGAGNSSKLLSYATVDKNPYKGISYYRLKQTDFDGKYSYSKLMAVNNKNSKNFEFKIFPNPTDGQHVFITSDELNDDKTEVLVVLYDALGKEVYSKIILTDNGSFFTAIDSYERLVPGIYFIVGSSNNEIYRQKLIVK